MDGNDSPIVWSRLQSLLDRHEHFLLTSHVRPDCDALGSELAMARMLDALGKQVRIVNADPTPPRLAFLDPQRRIEVLDQAMREKLLQTPDVLIVLDTGAWLQLGRMADVVRATAAQLVVIDHHSGDGELSAMTFKDPEAEATGRLVADLAQFLGLSLDPASATALFAAIATDTGWFRFPSTKSSTYRVAARLIEAGAVPHEIYRCLYECDSPARLKLRGRVLERIVTEWDGLLAHTYVRAHDFAETGAQREDVEDFVNMALVIEGIEVAVLVTEQAAGTVRVNFRSRSGLDCSRLAKRFQGGGHKAAAGATIHGPFPSVWEQVLEGVRAAMGEFHASESRPTAPGMNPLGVADKRRGNA